MTKTTYQNEQRKREFFEHLRGVEGFAEDSVIKFAEAVGQWQTFTDNDDFSHFDKTKAMAFVSWLRSRKAKNESGQLALITQDNYLRRLQRFFKWLSGQPNYRTKALRNEAGFLRLSKKDARIARAGTTRRMPTLEEAQKLVGSIEIRNDIDRRDRAMICFALITGCRIGAYTSLRMKNFDKERRLIDQNPGDGVKTKNSKKILTAFFPIGWDAPEQYFMEWYEYLEQKGFGPDDPIFPATLGGVGSSGYSREQVGRTFWSGTNSARKVFEKRCSNADVHYFHPHSFRHLAATIMSKMRLTVEEMKAVSLNFGHEEIITTFGAYGSMNNEEAVKIVQKLKDAQNNGTGGLTLTDEERVVFERVMRRLL
jgi:integrase